jgi:serine/threonine-protein kinase
MRGAGSDSVVMVGRYALHDVLAAGGMAQVHFGRLVGPAGFARLVAIKRLHAHYAHDREFVAMFLDEARLAARIRHPNVVSIIDVVAEKGEAFLVMDYIAGESLSRVIRALTARGERIPPPIAAAIISSALEGLHAAHQVTGDHGEPLGIVHRDVSPQNVLLGADGIVRLIDFGVAKAGGRLHQTRRGEIKGKMAYMSPEQLAGEATTAATDIFAAGVVLWEMLTGERLFRADTPAAIAALVLAGATSRPSGRAAMARTLPTATHRAIEALDDVAMRALARSPAKRFASAREMALAVTRCVPPASAAEVAALLQETVGDELRARAAVVAKIERASSQLSLGDLSEFELGGAGGAPPPQATDTILEPPTFAAVAGPPIASARASGGGRRHGFALAAMIASAIACVVLVAGLALHRRGREDGEASRGAALVTPALDIVPSSAVVPPASATISGEPPASADVATAPVTTMPAPPPAPPPTRAVTAAGKPAAKGSPASSAHPSAAQVSRACTPPFFFDAKGNKVFKEECL